MVESRLPPYANTIRKYRARTLPGWATFAAVFVTNLVIFSIRRPGALTHAEFWAEDSVVFYRDQLLFGSPATLLRPYSGYFSLAARVIALAGAWVPAAWAPPIFCAAALVLAALSCSILVLPPYAYLIGSTAVRAALCVLFAAGFFVPEMLGNVTNLQWYLVLPGILLLARPRAAAEAASLPTLLGCAGTALLIGLSAPQLILLLPVCAVVLWRRRISKSSIVASALLIAIAIQAITASRLVGQSIFPVEHALPGDLTLSILYRVMAETLAGRAAAMRLGSSPAAVVSVVLALLSVSWFGWLWRVERARRPAIAAALYLMLGSVAVAIVVRARPAGFADFSGVKYWWGERYFYLAACVFAFLVALSISHCVRSGARAALLLAGLFSYGVVNDFRLPPLKVYWPQGAPVVEQWRREIRQGRIEPISIPVNPAPWRLNLPGSELSNAGFESGEIAPWSPFGAAEARVSGDRPFSGRYALSLAGRGGVFEDVIGLEPGASYRVSARARSDCAAPGQATLWLRDASGQEDERDGPRTPGCSDWNEFSLVFRIPKSGMLRVHLRSADAAGRVYWDDVQMVKLP